jgi:hypothetical protein
MAEIATLSDDILFLIFSQLEVDELVHHLQFVCKRFYSIIHHSYLWYLIYETNTSSQQFLQLLGSKRAVDNYCAGVSHFDMKQVLSYLRCHSCNKYDLKTKHIYYCHCLSQTCTHCQEKIKSYDNRCMACTKPLIRECDYCREIVPRSTESSVELFKSHTTHCCHKVLCSNCMKQHDQFKTKYHSNGGKIVLCRAHCYVCEICGQWSETQYVATCCHRTICRTCLTMCSGCQTYHCIDHCQQNKCIMEGCCFASRTTNCVYNGVICSQCHRKTPSVEMRCHPAIRQTQKYCASCLGNKTWICHKCDQILPAQQLVMCDMCLTVECMTHMTFIRNSKYVCQKCIRDLYDTCDICQQIYSLSMINLKICRQCSNKFKPQEWYNHKY